MAKKQNRQNAIENLSTTLSAFYAKFVIVLGIAFPVTDILSLKAPPSFYQGFYLYLYLVSVAFVVFVFATHLRTRAYTNTKLICALQASAEGPGNCNNLAVTGAGHSVGVGAHINLQEKPIVRYGSFYLRIGAIAFGIGSMVYSGLDFGQYFELKDDTRCQNILIALNPAARICLILVQMNFIFLNTKYLNFSRHKAIAKFGLMHMIATNICEWLYILVEETKHEIVNIQHNLVHDNTTKLGGDLKIVVECRRTNIMGNLVQNASPFLFPCNIEYSLICAVTLYEMWKSLKSEMAQKRLRKISKNDRDSHHFSVDCSKAHCGLFGGIFVVALTIIALTVYFEMRESPVLGAFGLFEIEMMESILYVITFMAVVIAMYKMRFLRYSKSYTGKMAMDCALLLMAQSGVFIYTMFSIMASYFSLESNPKLIVGLAAEILSLLQTSAQTLFIQSAWWRRCRSSAEIRNKPARGVITFLLIANMALWSINSLIKSRASFMPSHLEFFGKWAWTIITHTSMPLAIFYRLHSTICLFEIWKCCYKFKAVN